MLAYADFPYPITLTTWHMVFCSLVSAVIIQTGAVKAVDGMTFGASRGPCSYGRPVICRFLRTFCSATAWDSRSHTFNVQRQLDCYANTCVLKSDHHLTGPIDTPVVHDRSMFDPRTDTDTIVGICKSTAPSIRLGRAGSAGSQRCATRPL